MADFSTVVATQVTQAVTLNTVQQVVQVNSSVPGSYESVALLGLGVFNVKAYGATGDGTTDDSAAIQSAINAAIAARAPLYVPPGTYLLNGTRQQAYRATSTQVTDTILVIGSNLTMFGAGYDTVFKVADDYTDGGDYRVFAANSVSVSNVELSHFRIDGNGLNNLVIDSSSNVRRAYQVNLLSGDNLYIHDCWFTNCPGRNVLAFGNNSSTPDWANVRIVHNRFLDVGGAIVGNENQNDHSSIYLQANPGLVEGNLFQNTTQPSPLTPSKAVVALEIHGRNTLVLDNIVKNYTGGGNCVASVHNAENNQWVNNKFYGMTGNCLTLWTASGFTNKRLSLRGNVLENDNLTEDGGTGIFQSTASGTTSLALEDLVIEDNILYSTLTTGKAVTTPGMLLCAIDGGSIRRNIIRRAQGAGISLEAAAVTVLSIRNVDVDDNEMTDCGMHTSASRLWGIYLANVSTTADSREIAKVNVRRNRIRRTAAATVLPCRGIRVNGVAAGNGGYINDVVFEGNVFENIQRLQRYDFNNTFNNRNVSITPTAIGHVSTSDPTFGFWQAGVEYVVHSDTTVAATFGKVPTTSGAAVTGLWATATQYTVGQWVRNSANKVFKCVTTGTSSSGSEPTSSTLGELVTDGTVTWMYVDTVLAVFATRG